MNHKSRQNSFRRDRTRKNAIRTYILYVEGRNTEKSYFDLLKKANCKIIPVVKRGHGISKCADFVIESHKAWMCLPKTEREKYKKVWLVFDADGRDDFAEAIALAREYNFGVAFSNMCIEYWFLLHFYEHNGKPIPLLGDSHSAAQIKCINDFIRKYNKKATIQIPEYDSGSKTVCEDFLDLMLAVDPVTGKPRIVTAFERAKIIHETKKASGTEYKESVTTIYALLQELGVIEETADHSYVLYRK